MIIHGRRKLLVAGAGARTQFVPSQRVDARIFLETEQHIMNGPEGTFATREILLERRLRPTGVTFDNSPVNIFGPKEPATERDHHGD